MSRIFRDFWYSVNDVIYHLKLNRTQGESKLRAEPHTHKVEETHELIFSWLSWVAVFHVGRTTTATESHKIAAVFKLICQQKYKIIWFN